EARHLPPPVESRTSPARRGATPSPLPSRAGSLPLAEARHLPPPAARAGSLPALWGDILLSAQGEIRQHRRDTWPPTSLPPPTASRSRPVRPPSPALRRLPVAESRRPPCAESRISTAGTGRHPALGGEVELLRPSRRAAVAGRAGPRASSPALQVLLCTESRISPGRDGETSCSRRGGRDVSPPGIGRHPAVGGGRRGE